MDFTSDNTCGVSPEVLDALSLANTATAAPYGADAMSEDLNKTLSRLFGKQAFVFPVVTGTAANALALSAICQPWEAVLTHQGAHINVMECGAPEALSGGLKILGVEGCHGKITCDDVEKAVHNSGQGVVHRSQVRVLSLAQTTDKGTVYTVEELTALSNVARQHGLYIHMDGARFANAVVALGVQPAELVAHVDVLSFGTSKNGTLNAEAVVFFDADLARNFPYLLKQAGHLVSKARFLSAQILAYVTEGLWLKNAQNANDCAADLARQLAGVNDVIIAEPVQSNMVFLDISQEFHDQLRACGVTFYSAPGQGAGRVCIRLVTGFSTTRQEVAGLVATFNQLILRKVAA